MSNDEIITKAIQKALDNGFKEIDTTHLHPELRAFGLGHNEIYATIFSHYFAKAFFGEENGSPCLRSNHKCEGWHPDDRPKEAGYYPRWKYHLQQMVLKEDPIKYLANLLEGKLK